MLLLALAAMVAPAAAQSGGEGEARACFQRGLRWYNAGQYAQALDEFEAGYRIKPLPLFLFNAAQAARRSDRPAHAIDLYRRFLAAAPTAPQHAEAERYLAALEASTPPPTATPPAPAPDSTPLTATPTAAPTATPTTRPPPTPPTRPTAAPAPTAAIAAPAPPAASPSPPPIVVPMVGTAREHPVHTARDRLGGALLGIGSAAIVTGVVLVAVGGAAIADADTSYARFDAAHKAQSLAWAGGATLAAGALIAAGAGLRYGLVARRARLSIAAALTPSASLLTVGGRF